MTGGRNANKKGNQSPSGSQNTRATNAMADLCTSVDEICSVDNSDDDVIGRLQEMLREKAEQPALTQNAATAVAVTQLLLPVMGFSMWTEACIKRNCYMYKQTEIICLVNFIRERPPSTVYT